MNEAADGMESAQGRIADTYGQMADNSSRQAEMLGDVAGYLIGNGAFDGIFSGRSATTPTYSP